MNTFLFHLFLSYPFCLFSPSPFLPQMVKIENIYPWQYMYPTVAPPSEAILMICWPIHPPPHSEVKMEYIHIPGGSTCIRQSSVAPRGEASSWSAWRPRWGDPPSWTSARLPGKDLHSVNVNISDTPKGNKGATVAMYCESKTRYFIPVPRIWYLDRLTVKYTSSKINFQMLYGFLNS